MVDFCENQYYEIFGVKEHEFDVEIKKKLTQI